MSNNKSKIANTEIDNLVSNLRAEVGAIVDTFMLMRDLKVTAARIQTGNITQDLRNTGLEFRIRTQGKARGRDHCSVV